MANPSSFFFFLTAAAIFAITPGPGILYIFTRSLKGGRREGTMSAIGTAAGGAGHVVVVALGLSTVLATSVAVFNILKYAGAVYLVYLGIRALRYSGESRPSVSAEPVTTARVFFQGFMNEVLNPKTPLFFLAFIPQFIDPGGVVIVQFMALGFISVLLNLIADLLVATLVGPIGQRLTTSAQFRNGQRVVSGWTLIGLGAYIAAGGQKQ